MKLITGEMLANVRAKFMMTTGMGVYSSKEPFTEFLGSCIPIPEVAAYVNEGDMIGVTDEVYELITTLYMTPHWRSLIKARCIKRGIEL